MNCTRCHLPLSETDGEPFCYGKLELCSSCWCELEAMRHRDHVCCACGEVVAGNVSIKGECIECREQRLAKQATTP